MKRVKLEEMMSGTLTFDGLFSCEFSKLNYYSFYPNSYVIIKNGSETIGISNTEKDERSRIISENWEKKEIKIFCNIYKIYIEAVAYNEANNMLIYGDSQGNIYTRDYSNVNSSVNLIFENELTIIRSFVTWADILVAGGCRNFLYLFRFNKLNVPLKFFSSIHTINHMNIFTIDDVNGESRVIIEIGSSK